MPSVVSTILASITLSTDVMKKFFFHCESLSLIKIIVLFIISENFSLLKDAYKRMRNLHLYIDKEFGKESMLLL